MIRYAASISAVLPMGNGVYLYRCKPAILDVHDYFQPSDFVRNMAEAYALDRALEEWPIQYGWIHHASAAMFIPERKGEEEADEQPKNTEDC